MAREPIKSLNSNVYEDYIHEEFIIIEANRFEKPQLEEEISVRLWGFSFLR